MWCTIKCRCKLCHLLFGEEQFIPEILKSRSRSFDKNMHILSLQFCQQSQFFLILTSKQWINEGTLRMTFSLNPRFRRKKVSHSFLSLPNFCHIGSTAAFNSFILACRFCFSSYNSSRLAANLFSV